jgi:phosphoadenosine phosphosulfate reductase
VALIENTLFGEINKIDVAIKRLQTFEPPEGYYLAFSGGKDSQTIYHLSKEAGVKFDAHYNHTTVDAPEVIYFMRENYSDVIVDYSKETMWDLIEKKGLPTRLHRFCCKELKEHGGEGRICITGVRWDESDNRKKNRNMYEIVTAKKADKILFNDSDKARRVFENCTVKGKRVVNPIVDWEESDVWEYLNSRGIKHCELYDEGHKRIGCIGCPMSGKHMETDFIRWPKYKDSYIRAIKRFLPHYLERCKQKNKEPFRNTAEEWFHWWIYESEKQVIMHGQVDIDEYAG